MLGAREPASASRSPSRARRVTIRWRRPNASREGVGGALAEAVDRPRASPPRAATSSARPGSPQATTQLNGSRSLSTLTAKPCIDTRREMWTPIERDLAVADPDAGELVALARSRGNAGVGERVDERALHRGDVLAHVGHVHDRVADELAGPVVGQLAAALVSHDVDVAALDAAARRAPSGGRACRRAGARAAAAGRAARRPARARAGAPGARPPRGTRRGRGGRSRARACPDGRGLPRPGPLQQPGAGVRQTCPT